jgi:energy-coupling factor transporter ATP-binding protein EcfA2
VTHDVSEALTLADRVVMIDEGRITLDIAIPHPHRAVTAMPIWPNSKGACWPPFSDLTAGIEPPLDLIRDATAFGCQASGRNRTGRFSR